MGKVVWEVKVNAPQLSAHTWILQLHLGRLGPENLGADGALALFATHTIETEAKVSAVFPPCKKKALVSVMSSWHGACWKLG